ncbi:hypothetical protein [Paenibacillus wenxiniae]|uniref:Uncharacterized protein n=1 Tax=Paenibacillus wenxiniae TaxID=1636843 RepID=A0ABW4RJJ8_9BACL
MNAEKTLSEIEAMHYWDARVLQLDSSFFGDEITLVFEDTDFNVKLSFIGCSSFSLVASKDGRLKPLRELTRSQIPYFLQHIEITDMQSEGYSLLKCKISMPLSIQKYFALQFQSKKYRGFILIAIMFFNDSLFRRKFLLFLIRTIRLKNL